MCPWQDNFGRCKTEDALPPVDPLQLEPPPEGSREGQDSTQEQGRESTSGQLDSALQNPNGATQMFTDMHGIPGAIEEEGPLDRPGGRTETRQMANLTDGGQRSGVTDWGAGTDGGRSGKPQVGVTYGSFAGV